MRFTKNLEGPYKDKSNNRALQFKQVYTLPFHLIQLSITELLLINYQSYTRKNVGR